MLNKHNTEKYTCSRCGFDYLKSKLKRQRGMYLSHDCFDDLSKIPTHRPRFGTPNDFQSTGIPPEATPGVYIVTAAAGIAQLTQSHSLSERRDGEHLSTFMQVVSDGGAVDIVADPQIVAGQNGDILTIRGTSNTDTVQLDDSETLHLIGGYSMVLKEGDTINLVYNTFDVAVGGWGISQWGTTGYGFGGATEGWVEVSRYKGGI